MSSRPGMNGPAGVPTAGGGGGWSGAWDNTNDFLFGNTDKNGIQSQGNIGGIAQAAGAISNAYLGYQGLQEARKNREMQEKYAAANLYNQATGYNANVRDVGANNAAINGWDQQRQDQYVANNQAKTTV